MFDVRPFVRSAVLACAVPLAVPVPLIAQVVRTATRVEVLVRPQVVQVEVTETFVNRGRGLGEADYLFPLPAGAAFEDLRLSINGELVAGEVLDAARARAVYEEIVRRQRDPALVEWMGRGLVRTRIFPINPGEEKRVVLRYTQPATREGDAVRFDWRPARGAAVGGDAPTTVTLRVEEASGFGAAYSPTHDLRPIPGAPRAVEASVGGADFTALVPVRRAREASITALTHAPGGTDRWMMLSITPPAATARRQPRDLTFVLDVSGSMSGRKLEQAKAAGRQLLETLGAGDRLRLIAFAGDVRPWREGFAPVTATTRREAAAWLDALSAGGGTNIDDALAAALAGHRAARDDGAVPLVLFVTDGEPTVGERNPEHIADSAKARRGAVRLFTFGLGADVNATLVERLALEGRGTAQFVRPNESVERAVGLAAERLSAPLVTDLRVRLEGARLVRMHPEGPLDVFAGQDAVVFAQIEGSGAATLVVTGRTAQGPVTWREPVRIPAHEPANAFVGRLWATQRVGWLSAERRRNGASSELDAELRALGERWGIPTELTSYLVLEPGMTPGTPGTPVPMPVPMPAPVFSTRADAGSAASAPASAKASTSELVFESARRASAMRAATSVQAADAEIAAPVRAADERRAAGRRFVRANGAWADAAIAARDGRAVVTIAPYSAAWFALADALPALREVFALGDAVRVAGRRIVIVVADNGRSSLSADELARVVRDW